MTFFEQHLHDVGHVFSYRFTGSIWVITVVEDTAAWLVHELMEARGEKHSSNL